MLIHDLFDAKKYEKVVQLEQISNKYFTDRIILDCHIRLKNYIFYDDVPNQS